MVGKYEYFGGIARPVNAALAANKPQMAHCLRKPIYTLLIAGFACLSFSLIGMHVINTPSLRQHFGKIAASIMDSPQNPSLLNWEYEKHPAVFLLANMSFWCLIISAVLFAIAAAYYVKFKRLPEPAINSR